ncbi:MAG: pyridoxal-phosphate dependent enzyme, partial [Opitutales bacterium]|nr:pyridoxal-phosphate dependent enzyme [Opitutales bacterium]
MSFPTTDDLIKAILDARKRVYEVASSTPLERMELEKEGAQLYLKREDLSPIHAYKWRGSYNRMYLLSQEERNKGVVCASAGNHAQGVALAAQKLNTHASIYMPRSTPQMKISSVERIGGDAITI